MRSTSTRASPRSATTCSRSQRFKVDGDAPVPAGTHQVRMEFAYDGGGLAKGGDVTLYVDGDASAAKGASRRPSR